MEIAEELELDELRAHTLNTIGRRTGSHGGDRDGLADLERASRSPVGASSPRASGATSTCGSMQANFGDLRRAAELTRRRGRRDRYGDAAWTDWLEAQAYQDYWAGSGTPRSRVQTRSARGTASTCLAVSAPDRARAHPRRTRRLAGTLDDAERAPSLRRPRRRPAARSTRRSPSALGHSSQRAERRGRANTPTSCSRSFGRRCRAAFVLGPTSLSRSTDSGGEASSSKSSGVSRRDSVARGGARARPRRPTRCGDVCAEIGSSSTRRTRLLAAGSSPGTAGNSRRPSSGRGRGFSVGRR